MFKETDLGFEHKDHNKIVFYGKKNCDLAQLIKAYPQFIFRQTKQIHSDICVESNENQNNIEADAHYTTEKNIALVIKTADCLPILINTESVILAIHAGWRGVENKITYKSLKLFNLKKPFQVFIGPHILQNSFEVDTEVKDALVKSAGINKLDLSFLKGTKHFVNLQSIVEAQIQQVAPAYIYKLNIDTFKNSLFNSFRTDKTQNRNLSFIAKI